MKLWLRERGKEKREGKVAKRLLESLRLVLWPLDGVIVACGFAGMKRGFSKNLVHDEAGNGFSGFTHETGFF